MEDFLRKYGWVLTLAFIAVGSTLVAIGINNLLASQLAPYTVPDLPEVKEQVADKGPQRNLAGIRQWDGTIADLCLFGCKDVEEQNECPGGCAEGEECQEGVCVPLEEESRPRDSSIPVESDAPLKLLGTMSAENARYSMALIMDEDSNQTHVVSPDDYIDQDILVVEVRRDRVVFERDGQLEFIRMANSISGNPTPVSVGPAAVPTPVRPSVSLDKGIQKKLAKKAADDGGDAVEKAGDGDYKVDRESIKKQLDNPKDLATQGRVIPNYKNGQRNGLKIVGVRPNSVYQDLGIQSGDVLRGVNGREINTQQEALELFEKLKTEDEVEIQVERRGQQKELKYNIE
ncbi:MAG: type II secretion system protein GspC [Myxococcota bacterium]